MHALSITVRAVLFVSKIFFLLCFCLLTTKIYTRGILFMRFSIYKLKINLNSPFVSLLKDFNKRYFPYIYSKSSTYLEGYFFFYGGNNYYYFLRQFCVEVEPIFEDDFSSLRLSYIKKYYTNNKSFFDYYFNLSRYDVSSI